MIISHKHRFIFIHCRKSAGSSVVVSLSRFLGEGDLQLSSIPDGAALKIYPPKRVLNEALLSFPVKEAVKIILRRKKFWTAVSTTIKRKYSKKLGKFPQHSDALTIKNAFPFEWENYFKFCVVRNPWDKTVSDYFWRTRKIENPPSFEQYVHALADNNPLNGIVPQNHYNWNMYAIDGRIAVDYTIKFEDLERGLSEALKHTSVEWDGWMPHAKSMSSITNSEKKRDYRKLYNDTTSRIISELYRDEIKHFGYSFD